MAKIDANAPYVPEESKNGQRILSYSNEQIFNRYFTEDNGVGFGDDFDEVINIRNEEDEKAPFVYKNLTALAGDVLNYVRSKFHLKIVPFVPEGYKINTATLVKDIESILEENPNAVRQAGVSNKLNPFIRGSVEFLLTTLNKGLEYKIELGV